MGKVARLEGRTICAIDAEAAGHAEMHHEHLAVIEFGQEIFCAPVERLDPSPSQPPREILRQGKAQVRAPLLDIRETIADEDRLKSAPDRLDLRQLGHRPFPYCSAKNISIAPQQ
jgi:hypothetical protein